MRGVQSWAVVGEKRGLFLTSRIGYSKADYRERRENGIFPGIHLTILYATAIPATTAKANRRTELEIAAEGKQRLDEPQA